MKPSRFLESIRSRLTYRNLAFLALAALAASLLPLLAISIYDHPCTDDYNYGAYAAQAVREGGIWSAFPAAWRKTVETYQNWQGTFSAVYLMCLHPAVFGEGFYFLTPFLMLGSLLFSTFFFLQTFLGRVCGACRHAWVLAGCGAAFFSIQFAPSAFEGFFWYNGSLFYTFFYSLSLCLYALVLRVLRAERPGIPLLALAGLLSFVIGGGNYSTALLAFLLLALAAFWAFFRRKGPRVRAGVLLCLGLEGAAFLVSVVAPGNAVRQALLPNHPGPVEAVGKALLASARLALESTGLPMLLLLAALAPILYRCAGKLAFAFPCPALAPVAAVCLVGVEMTPPMYAMGHTGGQRMLDMYYYTYCLLALGVEFYLLGWLAHREKTGKGKWSVHAPEASFWAAALLGAALLCSPGLRDMNGASALISLKNGEAKAYHQQMMERIALYQDPAVKRMEASPITAFPQVLHPSGVPDLTEDPESTANRYAAFFYEKESVVKKTE